MVETSEDLRKRLELQDHGHEMAGLETGRAARFGIGAGRAAEAKEKERSERAFRNALERLLQDAEYRRLYEQLGERLGDAEREADATITALEDQLRKVGEQIADMESSAARGPDGRAVFRYVDGRVVYADGSEVPDDIADGIIWPDNGPSAEDYFAAKQRQADLSKQLDEWNSYRNDTLGGIRDRYDDPGNPYEDAKALEGALRDIEEARPSLTSMVAPAQNEVSLTSVPAADLALPTQLR